MRMSKKTLVPKLRFPEFKDSKGWITRQLGELGVTYTGLTGKSKEDFGKGDARFITYLNVFGNLFANTTAVGEVEIDSKQNEVKYGDIFFTTSSETPDEVGMSSVWLHTTENIYLNSFCFGFRPSVELSPYYMAFMLRSPAVRARIALLAQGISRYNISKTKLMEIDVPLPSFFEQQKIADCLSSLGDLITAENKKLVAIKTHKKGLMQKLFPAEGKAVPQVRFGGYTGDWEQRKLEEVVDIIDGDRGKNYPGDEDFREQGHTLFLSATNVTKDGFSFESNQYITEEKSEILGNGKLRLDDIVLTSRGSLGHIAWYTAEIHQQVPFLRINSGMLLLRSKEDVAPIFIEQLLKSPIGKKQID
jgi:type I restriction enzyme S subunit